MPRGGPPRVQVRLLGPHRTTCAQRAVVVGSSRQRALLVALALSMNEALSVEAIIGLLWGDTPPRSAKGTVHSLVSRLRTDLAGEGGGPLRTVGAGYLLEGDPADVDALDFLARLESGRRQAEGADPRAADTFGAALALWTGPAMLDLTEYQFARLESERLLEAKFSAVEELAEAELARGRPRDALALAEGLTADQPLRERAWAARILALYRLGRQGDALTAHRALRRLLREELGADPTAELAELENAVLRHDPRLRLTVSAATTGGPLPPELEALEAGHFVGRSDEVERAEAFLSLRGRAGILWLEGEPGIGKTRLMARLARRARDRGATVLFGRCTEDMEIPYQPFLSALRWFAAAVSPQHLAACLGESPDELARLVPEIGQRIDVEPAAGRSDAHRMFEGVRNWLGTAGGSRPTVLVLDDLHWASSATLALLAYVCRSSESMDLTVVATARSTAPDDRPDLAELAETLDRQGVPTCRIDLGGLGYDEVRDLVGLATGRSLDPTGRALAADLHAETGGHPLFVGGILAALAEDGSWDTAGMPRSVAESVRRRVDRLPGPVGDVLRVAALIGLDFEVPVLAGACGRTEDEVVALLEDAMAAGLVEELAVDRHRFAHGLVRAALRQTVSRSRQARIHLAIARVVEAAHREDLEPHAVALATHYYAAAQIGGPGQAYRFARMAAEQAERIFAHDDAATAYARAIELTDVDDVDTRIDLTIAQAKAQCRAGKYDDARSALTGAAKSAAARRDAPRLARAACAYDEASVYLGIDDPVWLELARQAVEWLPDEPQPLRATVLATFARALHFAGRKEEARTVGDQAVRLARSLGDPGVLASVLLCRMQSARASDRAVEQVALGREIQELIGSGEGAEVYLRAAGLGAEAAARLGDLRPWDELIARQHELVPFRQPYLEHLMLMRRQVRAVLAADLDSAALLLREAEELGRRAGWELDGMYAIAGILLRLEQGRLAALLPALGAIEAAAPRAGMWAPGVAMLYAASGQLAEAAGRFETDAADSFGAVPRDDTREAWIAFLAETCAALGDVGRAPWLRQELTSAAGTLLVTLPMGVCLGPADRLIGNLTALIDGPEAAAERLLAAVEFCRGLPSPLWTAHCLYDLARHLRVAHPERATASLFEARELCAEHGLAGLGGRVELTLQSL